MNETAIDGYLIIKKDGWKTINNSTVYDPCYIINGQVYKNIDHYIIKREQRQYKAAWIALSLLPSSQMPANCLSIDP